MPQDHIDDSTDALERQASPRFIRHEVKAIVAGDPVQIVKAIARLDEQLLREEGRPAFSPPLDPDGHKPWGVGPQPMGKPRQAFLAIPPDQVESIEISVYAFCYWDVAIVPQEPSPQIGTMKTVGFLRFLSLPNARTEITFVCYEVGWDNLRSRWEQLCNTLDMVYLGEVQIGLPSVSSNAEGTGKISLERPGRKNHVDHDEAFVKIYEQGLPRSEVYNEWLKKRAAAGTVPDNPKEAFDLALKRRRKKAGSKSPT